MDLQDLKNVWDKENVDATPEISLDKQKEMHLPLEKIRSNMRMEFYTTIVLLVAALLYFEITSFLKKSAPSLLIDPM